MAEVVKASSKDVIDIKELVSLTERKVDFDRPESLVEMSEHLQAFANNEEVFVERIHKDLLSYADGIGAMYSPQSCLLYSEDRLHIRINLWPMLPTDPRRRKIMSGLLSYGDFHDHNFSFLTANYFGPGYQTELYNYSRKNMVGLIGEKVDAEYLGKFTLDTDTVINFVSQSDFHSQLEPKALSASVNLMVYEEQGGYIDQYYFDPKTSTISGYVEAELSKRVNAIHFAKTCANGRTYELLDKIADSHRCPRTRRAAYEVLLEQESGDKENLYTRCADDDSLIVQQLVAEKRV